MTERSSGILLHPSSLPGPFGIGDLGPAAYRWVDPFAAVRESLGGAERSAWPKDVLARKSTALDPLGRELGDDVLRHQFGQFLFDRQWAALKVYANGKGVKLIGDVPIFVAGDSGDVWAN